MMVILDTLVAAFAISMYSMAARHGISSIDCSGTRGPLFVVAGMLMIGIFCIANLTSSFALPALLGEEAARPIIEHLDFNIRWIVAAMTIALISTGFVSILSDRKRIAAAIGSLTTKLVHCEEHERRRIASYLHDQVGQSLVALRLRLDAITQDTDEQGQSEEIKQLGELIDETMEKTESLTYDLSPPVLRQFGLVAAIEWLGNKFSSEHKFQINFNVEGIRAEIDEEDAALLYRIVRELVVNAFKHACTASARVTVRWLSEVVSITVEDKGVGYDPTAATTGDRLGFGLTSVRDRMVALGGSLEIDARPGEGTRVELTVPLQERTMRFDGATP